MMLIDTLNVGVAGVSIGYIVARQQLLGWRGAFIDQRLDRSQASAGMLSGFFFLAVFWFMLFVGSLSAISAAAITVTFSISAAICTCTYRWRS